MSINIDDHQELMINFVKKIKSIYYGVFLFSEEVMLSISNKITISPHTVYDHTRNAMHFV